jgi:hypothetical protein
VGGGGRQFVMQTQKRNFQEGDLNFKIGKQYTVMTAVLFCSVAVFMCSISVSSLSAVRLNILTAINYAQKVISVDNGISRGKSQRKILPNCLTIIHYLNFM